MQSNRAVPWALLLGKKKKKGKRGKKGLHCVLQEVVLKNREGKEIVPTFSQSEGIFVQQAFCTACVLTHKKNEILCCLLEKPELCNPALYCVCRWL